ncbi:MAG: FHA domain-containing protein [Lentisphaeria bacterium]|nr:FHA domain-containing protein [Lentisphaeria bacterium]
MGLKSKKELQVRLEHEGRVLYEVPESEVTSEITIGRSQESTWCIPATDRSASNNHAAIVKKHGKLYVVDKGSRNGIYFQGAKVPEHKLSAGDQIGIGDCRIYADLPNVSGAKGPEREFHLLEQLNGEKKGEMYNLDKPNMRLGSASDCDIILNDSVVSHFHASIEQKEGGCWIRDLGSRNGTQVNGTPLSSSANDSGRLLKDGDIVTISYIELKFWDKYAVHVRSHLLLKIVTVVLTIAILLGGYFAWMRAMPSAKNYIDNARECARRCDFTSAREYLAGAQNARQAERYKAERTELFTQIAQWETTFKNWATVKDQLANRRWLDANKILSPMLSQNMEMWRWNDTDATAAKNEALSAKRVIDAYLESRSALEDADTTLEHLERSTEVLSSELDILARNMPAFCKELYTYAADTRDELKWTIAQLHGIEKCLQNLDTLEKLEEVISAIQNIKNEASEHSEMRKKSSKRYSPRPVRMAEDVLEPLDKLSKGKATLDGNYASVAALDFAKMLKELPLPTVEECTIYPVMADKRLQIEKLFKQLNDDSMQLERIWNTFKKYSLEPGKTPSCLTDLADAKCLDAVLSCDCLEKPLPKWSRKDPSGEYDKVLGVEAFYEYLSQLPSEFDSSILEEKPFTPEIFQARTLYGYLETLLAFLEKDTLTMVKQQKSNNKVMELALHADDLLMQREMLVETLKTRAEASNDRAGVIAGGMAMLLAKAGTFSAEYGDEIQSKCRKIRQKIMALQEGDMTPEQIIAVRKQIMQIGFPGDSLVKQAWSMEHPAQ